MTLPANIAECIDTFRSKCRMMDEADCYGSLDRASYDEQRMGLLDARKALESSIAELAAERDRAIAECKLMEHKVITCGVAAHHPDANLTRTGAYAEKWNSPQAEDVRNLRAERDAARQELIELDIYLRCQGTQGDSALDRAKRIVANTSLPGYVRLVEERDAAVAKCAAERAESVRCSDEIYSLLLAIVPEARGKLGQLAEAVRAKCAELERMLGVLHSDLESTNAALAAAKGKLAALQSIASDTVSAISEVVPAEPLDELTPIFQLETKRHHWEYVVYCRDRLAIAAAEQGGAS